MTTHHDRKSSWLLRLVSGCGIGVLVLTAVHNTDGGVCGDAGAGDCCTANGTPGCEDAGCCNTVCAELPFCCLFAWEQACADVANSDLCGGLCGGIVDLLDMPALHVDIVPSDRTMGVGQTIDLTAVPVPPLNVTGGSLMWTVLEGGRGEFGAGKAEQTTFTLHRPGLIRDRVGLEIGVVYITPNRTASNRVKIFVDEINFTRPYVKDWTLDVVGGTPDALPVPGDTVEISLVHAIPPGFKLLNESVVTIPDPLTVPVGPDTDLDATVTFAAEYLDLSDNSIVSDGFEWNFLLPFSEDLDVNGNPDLVDADFADFDAQMQALTTENPAPEDPARIFRIAGARWFAALAAHSIFPPEKFNKKLKKAYGVTTCNPVTWKCQIELGPLTRMPNDIDWLIITKIHELKHVFIYWLKHLGVLPCWLAEWWQDETKRHNGDFVEKWARLIAWWLFNIHLDPKDELKPEPPIPDKILALDDNPFQLLPPLRPTFNVEFGSATDVDLTIHNTHLTLALENIQVKTTFIETSLGEFIPVNTTAGVITSGTNGIAETVADPDDLQVTPVGEGQPMAEAIGPGPNGQLDSVPAGDDVLDVGGSQILSGLNGIVESTALVDDLQVAPVGTSVPGAAVVEAGQDGTLTTLPGGDDQVEFPPVSAIVADFSVVDAPVSIGPGLSLNATLQVVMNPRPEGTTLPEYAVLTVTVSGEFGGAPISIEHPLQLFLPATAAPCPWDCGGDNDGNVGIVDFLALLGQWTAVGTSCDFDGGGVGIVDFLDLLAHWGPCP